MEEDTIEAWTSEVSNPTVPVFRPGDVAAEAEVKRRLQSELGISFEPTLSFSEELPPAKVFLRWLRRRLYRTREVA